MSSTILAGESDCEISWVCLPLSNANSKMTYCDDQCAIWVPRSDCSADVRTYYPPLAAWPDSQYGVPRNLLGRWLVLRVIDFWAIAGLILNNRYAFNASWASLSSVQKKCTYSTGILMHSGISGMSEMELWSIWESLFTVNRHPYIQGKRLIESRWRAFKGMITMTGNWCHHLIRPGHTAPGGLKHR